MRGASPESCSRLLLDAYQRDTRYSPRDRATGMRDKGVATYRSGCRSADHEHSEIAGQKALVKLQSLSLSSQVCIWFIEISVGRRSPVFCAPDSGNGPAICSTGDRQFAREN